MSCGGTKNAANRKDPTATTAATSPAARTNGRPIVVTGPGSGNPVAVSAAASDSAPMPAAVQPASVATPTSSGHTTVRRLAAGASVMNKAYGRASYGRLHTACLCLAGDELVARDLSDVVEILKDGLQFAAKRDATLGQIWARV